MTIKHQYFHIESFWSLTRNLFFLFLLVFLFTGCIQEEEVPKMMKNDGEKIAQIKSWFEKHKENLRIDESFPNFRTESQELILPFFDKEPDWDMFHHYFFPDGREVFEINLENALKYYPQSMADSFPSLNPGEFVIQNIMFVKHPELERFDPLIVRYFPSNPDNKVDFSTINYNSVAEFWAGRIDLFTYDERHIVSFELLATGEKRTLQYRDGSEASDARIQGDCFSRSRQVVWISPSPGSIEDDPAQLGSTIHNIVITETICTGGGESFPDNGTIHNDGKYYYNDGTYDPGTSPRVPEYIPPAAPAPSIFIINQLNNPCAVQVFKELAKGSSKLTDMTGFGALDIFPWMLDLFKQGGKFAYYIEDVDIPQVNGAKINGRTLAPDANGTIVIQLDNSYVQNATSLSIARTIIHETVHAYIILMSRTNYEFAIELNNYYASKNENTPDTHHGMMSQYLLGMAVSLYNWDKNFGPTFGTLGFDYYYKMAFGGLLKDGTSQPIKEVEPMVPNGNWPAIEQILANEALGNSSAKGKKENCN